jgi:hypothetical protein
LRSLLCGFPDKLSEEKNAKVINPDYNAVDHRMPETVTSKNSQWETWYVNGQWFLFAKVICSGSSAFSDRFSAPA